MLRSIFLSGLMAAGLALGFVGCSSLGGGAPAGQAQVEVKGVLESQIEAKAEEVFYRHGFDFKGTGDGHMEFERNGGTLDNILYGNWQGKDITTRVTLYIIPKGQMTFILRARGMEVRNTFGGESDTQLFDVQSGRYGVILNKIAKELKEESTAAPSQAQ